MCFLRTIESNRNIIYEVASDMRLSIEDILSFSGLPVHRTLKIANKQGVILYLQNVTKQIQALIKESFYKIKPITMVV